VVFSFAVFNVIHETSDSGSVSVLFAVRDGGIPVFLLASNSAVLFACQAAHCAISVAIAGASAQSGND